MDNQTRQAYGAAAVSAGCADGGDVTDQCVDTIANILHYADNYDLSIDDICRLAIMHTVAELNGEE